MYRISSKISLAGLFISAIFLLYAKLEEEHGLARHAMAVYDRSTQAVLPEEQNEVRFIGFHSIYSLCMFDLILYVPVNNFSLMSTRVFLS